MAKAKKTASRSADDRTPDEWKGDILDAVLQHIPFDGWSEKAVAAACQDLALDPGIARLAFPRGPRDIVDHFLIRSDGEMLEALEDVDPATLKIRERIRSAVKAGIELHGGRKEAVGRTLAFMALPMNAALSARALWRTSDVIWRWAGDRATDYNHYTKRAILSAVYSSTLLYWLNDDSEGAEKTWGFLDRRIENVMQFEKLKAKVLCKAEKMPDITRRLGRLRYGK